MQETFVRSPGWEDPLEEVIAWRIPMDREPGGIQSMGSQKSDVAQHSIVQDTHVIDK